MEKANKLRQKRETTRKRKACTRKDIFMIAYVNKKYPMVYKEAEGYYNKLNASNPTKIDLRNTKEFKELNQTPPETTKDRMVLQIPITKQQQPQSIQGQPLPDGGMSLQTPLPDDLQTPLSDDLQTPPPDDLQDIHGIMEDHLPQDLIENIVKELKDDPHMCKLMNELEAEINLFNDDIEIDDDERLEEELKW